MPDIISVNDDLKRMIVTRMKEIIADKKSMIKSEIESATNSRNNETKSSAGDKYETGRAMVQYELEKAQVQLEKINELENELLRIDVSKKNNKVEYGSLVFTNDNKYFISIGLGKIELNNEPVFCISLNSPIGKILQNKKAGEKVSFRGKEITITGIC
jgi:transcription elongation GreA/GreB family factor